MNAGRSERFASKIDAWLIVLLVAALAIPVWRTVRVVASGNAPEWVLAVLLAPLAFVAWVFATTHYLVTDDELVVKFGPVERRIPIKSIVGIRPTRNPLSSPALSLDRLEIDYGSTFVLVSPREKERFVQVLTERGATAGAASGAPSRARSRLGRVMLFIVLPTVAAVAVLIYIQAQPPVVDIADGRIRIATNPRQEIPFSQVIGLTLEDRMPRVVFKRNGLNFGQILHGRFVLEGAPNALLYVQSRQPPFVRLETTRVIYINYAEPDRTRELYDRLSRELNR